MAKVDASRCPWLSTQSLQSYAQVSIRVPGPPS
jgi:hypothetical protein